MDGMKATGVDDAPVFDDAAPGAQDRYVDPFNGDSTIVKWATGINVGQLAVELQTALGDGVQLAAYLPQDEGGEETAPDESNPYVLFVSPSSVKAAAVRRVLAAHRPDPYFGMSEEDRARTQFIAKVQSPTDLSDEEMRHAVRLLMSGTDLRVYASTSGPAARAPR